MGMLLNKSKRSGLGVIALSLCIGPLILIAKPSEELIIILASMLFYRYIMSLMMVVVFLFGKEAEPDSSATYKSNTSRAEMANKLCIGFCYPKEHGSYGEISESKHNVRDIPPAFVLLL
ncbi:hypothetical protein H0E87_028551 [Populus deltoides]|uniref:Uncharacterized protein n=1 Tax=Populus deltoides TaxID=3696 RepID=A0A8T2WUQ8_POPDE|nr:hypothetical protein H0E87_028551 [Populus deltoides]